MIKSDELLSAISSGASVANLCRITGVRPGTAYARIARGACLEDAVTQEPLTKSDAGKIGTAKRWSPRLRAVFPDPMKAIEEAERLARSTGRRHTIQAHDRGYTVHDISHGGEALEIIRPMD